MPGTMTKPEAGAPRRWFENGPLASLRDEMDGLFENFFGSPIHSHLAGGSVPSIDLAETDESVEVKTDLPGIRAEDVDIEIRNDYLTISGETSEEKTEADEGRKYHRVERRSGSFARSVRLPCEVQQDEVDAELKDGVLTVTMPKAEEAKTTKVRIKG